MSYSSSSQEGHCGKQRGLIIPSSIIVTLSLSVVPSECRAAVRTVLLSYLLPLGAEGHDVYRMEADHASSNLLRT
jgi:hypothetical protein